ncbi:hypothetical protein C0V76_18570 [Uliginosibacterium sp. TH139]|nr:hypothetical protein C0V76_18570 [Uliginosibacterium sp. TH139]
MERSRPEESVESVMGASRSVESACIQVGVQSSCQLDRVLTASFKVLIFIDLLGVLELRGAVAGAGVRTAAGDGVALRPLLVRGANSSPSSLPEWRGSVREGWGACRYKVWEGVAGGLFSRGTSRGTEIAFDLVCKIVSRPHERGAPMQSEVVMKENPWLAYVEQVAVLQGYALDAPQLARVAEQMALVARVAAPLLALPLAAAVEPAPIFRP